MFPFGTQGVRPVKISLDDLNRASLLDFVAALGGVCENAPWIAEKAAARRPFDSVTALHTALLRVIDVASPDDRMAFLRGHPELGGKVARAGAMTDHSIAEQGSLGLDRLSDAEFDRFEALNAAYRARFGFPFIICVRRHTRDSILSSFARRLDNDPADEQAAAIAEIAFISRLRLVEAVSGVGTPVTTGRLSTRVTDSVSGQAIAGLRVSLHEIGASATAEIVVRHTDASGAELIAGEPLRIGTYEMRIPIGAHIAAAGYITADPPFLDIIPIRFAIAEPEGHYHLTVDVSPRGYTVRRSDP